MQENKPLVEVDHTTLVPMGRIIGAFGIKGWVKIKPDTSDSSALGKYSGMYVSVASRWVFYNLEDSFVQSGLVHAKFQQVTDRDLAMQLKGADVAIARADFPNTDTDEYYWVDLIGLAVYNTSGICLGIVANLVETGSTSVLVVEDQANSRELIPFINDYVLDVSLDAKKITVYWDRNFVL